MKCNLCTILKLCDCCCFLQSAVVEKEKGIVRCIHSSAEVERKIELSADNDGYQRILWDYNCSLQPAEVEERREISYYCIHLCAELERQDGDERCEDSFSAYARLTQFVLSQPIVNHYQFEIINQRLEKRKQTL